MQVVENYNNGFRPKSFINPESSKKILLYSSVLVLIYFIGFLIFTFGIKFKDNYPNEKTDAIIVLTGETKRIVDGVKEFTKGNAKLLFISGVHRQGSVAQVVNKTLNNLKSEGKITKSFDGLKSSIFIGKAENTIENGLESSAWVKKNDVKSIRLITSYYHMPRSKLIFEKFLPDVQIIYHPILLSDEKLSILNNSLYFKILFVEYNKFLVTYVWNKLGLESTFILKLQETL